MEELRSVSFEREPCLCVKRHSPVALVTERHHPHPQAEQRRVWGAVLDDRVVPLCGVAHSNVHLVLDALLRNQEPPRTSAYIRNLAILGYRRTMAARKGHRPGGPEYDSII